MTEHAGLADIPAILAALERIAAALEASGSPGTAIAAPDWSRSDTWIWHPSGAHAVQAPQRPPLELLVGVERNAATLLANTLAFARGRPGNNALLWGTRGMGKSTLVRAVHREICARCADEGRPPPLLIEISRDDIPSLPALMNIIRDAPSKRFVLFCDDLSFESAGTGYRALKTLLEGSVEPRPENAVFYATSNRRHLVPREMSENIAGSAIHPAETVEEHVSLSDRFGLWLGFYPADQRDYLEMVERHAKEAGLSLPPGTLHARALEWAMSRGGRSGRVAHQFIIALAGEG